MSFKAVTNHVRNPVLPHRHRVSALGWRNCSAAAVTLQWRRIHAGLDQADSPVHHRALEPIRLGHLVTTANKFSDDR